MAFVVEFEQSWAVRMVLLQVKVMDFRFRGGVAAVFAYIHLQRNEETFVKLFFQPVLLIKTFVKKKFYF